MQTVRRFLTFQCLMLWQGGFLFYAAFVVPIGTELLGSPAAQGAISQQAAWWLNVCGLAWAVVALWDALVDWPRSRLRLVFWAITVAALLGQWLLHPHLSDLFDAEAMRIRERVSFRRWHIVYLWLTTIAWFASLAYSWRMLADWTRPEFSR